MLHNRGGVAGAAAAACRIVFRTVNCEYDQCSHRQLPEPCSRVRTVLRILCANPVVNMCESWSRLHYTIGCGVDCSTVSSSITTNKKYDCMTTLARGVLGVLHLLSYYVVWPGQCRAVDRVCSKTVSWTLAATPHSLTSVRLLRWGYHLYSTLAQKV